MTTPALPDLADLGSRFGEEIKKVQSEEEVRRVKAAYLGKQGHISLFLRTLGNLPVELRPMAGAQANELKNRVEEDCRLLLEEMERRKKERQIQGEAVDITLPGRTMEAGNVHPITRVMEEVEEIFRNIGFEVVEGPEIETDFYNFEALNIPKDHPARDMQDTFYINVGAPLGAPPSRAQQAAPLLLRTHMSPVQIHRMKKTKPPIRMIAPGAVYRRDSDISHTPMFHQVEGLVVGEGVRFSDLKGTVSYFLQRLFGDDLRVRFRASYFPFTEPSAEVDIQCVICRGKGHLGGNGKSDARQSCRLCKESGWLEVMGCGMVHPAVFKNVGYDEKQSGFAFGMGIERLAMLKFGIPDIRLFFENDLRFLKQF